MISKMTPEEAQGYLISMHEQQVSMISPYLVRQALETVSSLKQEWGVEDAYGEIVWFYQEGEDQNDAENYDKTDKEFAVVSRYVSEVIR